MKDDCKLIIEDLSFAIVPNDKFQILNVQFSIPQNKKQRPGVRRCKDTTKLTTSTSFEVSVSGKRLP